MTIDPLNGGGLGKAERPSHLFVVRVWWEMDQDSSGEWRGSVEHVASREKRYFRDLKAVPEFVEAHLGQVAFMSEKHNDAQPSKE